jgi:hypothetical protein
VRLSPLYADKLVNLTPGQPGPRELLENIRRQLGSGRRRDEGAKKNRSYRARTGGATFTIPLSDSACESSDRS